MFPTAQSPAALAVALVIVVAGCGSASSSEHGSYAAGSQTQVSGKAPATEPPTGTWPDPGDPDPGDSDPGAGADPLPDPDSHASADAGIPPPANDTPPDPQDLDACASDTVTATQVPIDLLLLVDKSGSMAEATWGGTKWQAQTNAITAFVDHPDSAGMAIGLQFFPWNDSTGYPYCDVFSYSVPEVPIGPLPGQANAIKSSIAAQYPEGGTPTLPALTGALQAMGAWAGAHPGHLSAVVLATDGEPTECSLLNNVAGVAGLASAYSGQNPPVLTFVIGVGSSLFSLNSIANAGGTGQAFIIDTQQDVTQQFIDALNAIQSSVACQFQIPAPAQGTPDYEQVNVRYFPPGAAPVVVPGLADPSLCGAGPGWFYDNPASPSKIVLCAATCDAIRSYPQVGVEVVLGCETIRGSE